MRLHYIYLGKSSNSLENIFWNVFQKGLLIEMLKDMIYQKKVSSMLQTIVFWGDIVTKIPLEYSIVCCLVTKLYPTLCDPMDCSLPGSSVWDFPGKWVAISYSRRSSRPRGQARVSCISCMGRWLFTTVPPGKGKFEQVA